MQNKGLNATQPMPRNIGTQIANVSARKGKPFSGGRGIMRLMIPRSLVDRSDRKELNDDSSMLRMSQISSRQRLEKENRC